MTILDTMHRCLRLLQRGVEEMQTVRDNYQLPLQRNAMNVFEDEMAIMIQILNDIRRVELARNGIVHFEAVYMRSAEARLNFIETNQLDRARFRPHRIPIAGRAAPAA